MYSCVLYDTNDFSQLLNSDNKDDEVMCNVLQIVYLYIHVQYNICTLNHCYTFVLNVYVISCFVYANLYFIICIVGFMSREITCSDFVQRVVFITTFVLNC